MKLTWLSKKYVSVLLHILFWVVLFSLPSLFRPRQGNNPQAHREAENINFFYQYLVNCCTWIGLFYLNAYVIFPTTVYRKKYFKYVLSLVPVLALLSLIVWASFRLLVPKIHFGFGVFVFFYIFPCVFILACSIAFTMFRDKLRSDRLVAQKETENLKTELAFLRSQVSPHFMFNVLNNMVTLARKKSDQLEPSLFKLSSLLRYMLYETDEEKVLLEREVEYLQSYIDLQLQRFGSKVKVNLVMEDYDKNCFIEPMLLIPFVENAFKHGTGFKQNSEINIELKAKSNLLAFRVSNYYDNSIAQVKDKTSGIGLQNLKRRLDLLYKNEHAFTIENKDNFFTVTLQLNLH
ncbi:histidine kinase [Segetibacter sp.]|jgi:two-component system LytT family sensor kinase|uniref:sensor histidine kinase n=1 Tax=Segetibacter sp. TaxID=2231182 RepID=UPI0026219D81|nr:histidine kinase [Segetibacter sp.]